MSRWSVRRGEILALLGENGSGKTTLMNMLAGIYFPDEGEIYVGGQGRHHPLSPRCALICGIGMIHQHFKLVDVFTAAENIVLGLDGRAGWTSRRPRQSPRSARNLPAYGFDIDPDKKVYDMSVSEKQTVEIVKVLYRGADILILDEPTAVLTPQETDKPLRRHAQHESRRQGHHHHHPQAATRCWPSATGWPSCARASMSAMWPPGTPTQAQL